MMLSTHLLAGGLVGLLSAVLAPGHLVLLVAAGAIGGLFPDLDLLLEHRKTLHRPFQFTALFLALSGLYLAVQEPLVLVATAAAGGLVSHVAADILSQGKTKDPAHAKSDRVCYDHVHRRWLAPMNLVNVGSGRDLLLTYLFAAPFLLTGELVIRLFGAGAAVFGTAWFLMKDTVTNDLLDGYDRYSEFIQKTIGWGPETEDGS